MKEPTSQSPKKLVKITLPDGSLKEYPAGITGLEIAESISKSLAKEAVVVRVEDQLWDLNRAIEEDVLLSILTRKDEDVLEIFRHDAAHVTAEAVKELYPEVQVTIGPAIQNGFYYDFYREKAFTPEDLEKIEQRMREIVDRNENITREVWDRDKAIHYFKSIGENFKAEIIADLPALEPITLYRQGEFLDLCRGPHLPNTGKLGKAFKLMKVAGAYWRGDSTKAVLQRIYGTAWIHEKQLKDYLLQLEEVEKRDHRKLGKEMQLFHLQEEAPGCVFWHPKGWTLYRTIQKYIRKRQENNHYQEVNTPQLVDFSLWEASGHAEKFGDDMFAVESGDDRKFALKPMNCPCHVQIFKQGTKSYRELPLRFAEFGCCHRNEPSGSMHGIMRVRGFVQDDAHIFCTEEQITLETKKFCDFLLSVYKDFGFEEVKVKFSDRPEIRAGSDMVWDKAEAALKEATLAANLEFSLNSGEGAFYGPKLEFVLRDAAGRDWQCGTLQVDFVLPERLDAHYINDKGEKVRPVMLHRAILGTFERFIGILIENYTGRFPLWLAPVQVSVATITTENNAYAEEVAKKLSDQGLRVEVDLRNEKINYKIRELSLSKVPIIFVVGHKEQEEKTVTVRRLGSNEQATFPLEKIVQLLAVEAQMPSQDI